ncbi:DUF2807 domain-containing protein [Aquimarina sp. AD10]|uniref:head GIN domain-containing protein n=1 Tax=Aquimarina sp. AD10 TaxID=1714849 RepID=UPI000E50421E|nr:head GIN domain-containing protein [Aquimarina sp. AD10]AXT61661.1 DUF2807 domain-containing protein [Aquimarina sp. AD10]RKN00990.1 DUF2807 domain-containing protein [Aquimarina sp. AD10]
MIKYIAHLILAISMFLMHIIGYGQTKTVQVNHFDSAIISPHIQVTFKQGDAERVIIESSKVSQEKINIENEGKTLRIYLDGAKMVTKNVKTKRDEWNNRKKPLYKDTQVVATVIYKELKDLSIRGEEIIKCESLIEQDGFRLKAYGESKITMNALKVNNLNVTMYGESYLELKEGTVNNQKYTVYGEGKINTLGIANENTKITAYGEGNFRVNVSDHLKVTAFGEATVAYNGNPSINKGIVIGRAVIQKMN